MKLIVSDKVIFTQNDCSKYPDNRIRNGQRAEITDMDGTEIKYRTEDGEKVKLDMQEYGYIDYGYAMTTYKAQWQTFDKVVIDADTAIVSLNDMRNVYVNITHCIENIKIFTDDKDYLKELAQECRIEKDTMDIVFVKTVEDYRDKEIKSEHRLQNKDSEEIAIS
jgi:hypothetical protein